MKDLFSKNYKISWRRTYLPLLIVPLILGIVLSIMVFSVTRRQLSQAGQMSVEKFRTQASSIINELKIVNDSLLSNEQFVYLINQEIVSENDISVITRSIRNTLSKNSYVQDALVISKQHNKTYTGNAHYNYDSFVSLLQSDIAFIGDTDAFTEDDLKEGWAVPKNTYSAPFFVSYIHNEEGKKTATLVVVLNKAYLYRSLFVTNSDFCCMYNSDFLISSYIKSEPDTDYTSPSEISKLVGSPVEVFSVSDEHYTYLTALKRDDFYRPLYIILIAFVVYLLIVLLFAVIHIRNNNRREKAFFSSLVSELPQPASENADLDSIFSSIKNALDNYKEEHVAFSEQRKYKDLENLTQGYPNRSISSADAESMDIDPNAICFYMVRLHLSEEGILNPSHRNDLTCIIAESALNGFADGAFKAVCFPHRNNDVCAVLNVYKEEMTAEEVHQVIDHARTLMEKDYGIIFTCALSEAVTDITDIPKAFQDTIDLLRFVHAIDSNAGFISADELQDSPTFLIKGEFLKQLQILSGTLLIGKFDIIPDLVDAILEEHVAPLRKNYSLADERLQCIINMLHEAPLPANLSEDQVEELHNVLRSADSIAALSQAVHSCFETLQNADSDTIVDKAFDYISEQISSDMLSVPAIAEHVGVSVQHLSKRFKENTGMTMVEYINQYRSKKAQELLADTSLNISQIAEQTGYTNNVTFTRNFKKYVGCTPSEYREKIN